MSPPAKTPGTTVLIGTTDVTPSIKWIGSNFGQPAKHARLFSADKDNQPMAAEYRLVFIDRQDVQRFTVDGLTPGEARWMADVILREARRWFR